MIPSSCRMFAAALAFTLVTPPVLCQQEARLKVPELKYETYTLPNGLKVLTHEDHRLPIVAVDLWYHVGPLNERTGRTGFAHLFEHMMFEGSEHDLEKDPMIYLEGAGATDLNGTTSFDRTNYFETVPANLLERTLWLESDRMGFLMEGLDRTKLTNQRDVVRNERRQAEGAPYYVAHEEAFHLLFAANHPYYADVLGSHADIEAARIADIRDFHQQFYTPNNASIAIAGDFNPKQLHDLLSKYFGPIPSGPKVDPVAVSTPAITAQKRATVTDTIKLAQLTVAWLTPPAYTPGSYDLDSAMFALGGAKISRLDDALVYKAQVAQRVSCSVEALKLTGTAECNITAKPGVKLEDLEAALWKEVDRLNQDGPTAAEVQANKALQLSRKIVGFQRLGGFGGVADTLDKYNQYTGDPGYLAKDIAATEAVSVASTQAAARKYFTKDSAVVVYCVPGKKVLNDVPRSPDDTDAEVKIVNPYTPAFETSQEWRKAPPPAGPPLTVHLPVPQNFTLSNGLTVYVVEDKSLPVLSASLASRAGSEYNSTGEGGLASLTAAVLGEATTSRDHTQFAEAQQLIGTSIGVGASVDAARATMTMLTNHSQEGLNLLSDVVLHPAFHAEDLERLRSQRLVAIQQEGDSVAALASRVGPRLVYGDQPYGTSVMGTTQSVKGFTPEQIKGFYSAHYGPADSALVLAGDVTMPEAKKIAQQYFGGWTGKVSVDVSLPPAPQMPPTRVVIVDKPGAPQTALYAFGLGIPATSQDVPTLGLANETLGGLFSSRINMNLREQHGYTYGAHSAFAQYRAGGLFRAGGLVRTDVTGAAATELMGEIKRFPDNPPTAAELQMARDSAVQSLPGEFATTAVLVSQVTSIFIFNRPVDYYANLPAKLRAATAADIERIAKQDIHPNQLVIVAAGDRAKIEPQLKAANLGPIEVRDVEGNLVTE